MKESFGAGVKELISGAVDPCSGSLQMCVMDKGRCSGRLGKEQVHELTTIAVGRRYAARHGTASDLKFHASLPP